MGSKQKKWRWELPHLQTTKRNMITTETLLSATGIVSYKLDLSSIGGCNE